MIGNIRYRAADMTLGLIAYVAVVDGTCFIVFFYEILLYCSSEALQFHLFDHGGNGIWQCFNELWYNKTRRV